MSFIKTHTHFNNEIIEICKKYELKIIFTFRDIRDVLISRYHHILVDSSHRHHKIISAMKKKEGFLSSFENNDLNKNEPVVKYYYNWIKNWQKKKNLINHLELWYEDFVNNQDLFLKKIINFIGENESSYNSHKNYLSKEKIKNKEKNFINLVNDKSKRVSTFRSGKINNWKYFFDEEIKKKFNDTLTGPLDTILKK